MAHFWQWGPREAFDLTPTEWLWWFHQGNRIITRANTA
jgi:hypothetical protein